MAPSRCSWSSWQALRHLSSSRRSRCNQQGAMYSSPHWWLCGTGDSSCSRRRWSAERRVGSRSRGSSATDHTDEWPSIRLEHPSSAPREFPKDLRLVDDKLTVEEWKKNIRIAGMCSPASAPRLQYRYSFEALRSTLNKRISRWRWSYASLNGDGSTSRSSVPRPPQFLSWSRSCCCRSLRHCPRCNITGSALKRGGSPRSRFYSGAYCVQWCGIRENESVQEFTNFRTTRKDTMRYDARPSSVIQKT